MCIDVPEVQPCHDAKPAGFEYPQNRIPLVPLQRAATFLAVAPHHPLPAPQQKQPKKTNLVIHTPITRSITTLMNFVGSKSLISTTRRQSSNTCSRRTSTKHSSCTACDNSCKTNSSVLGLMINTHGLQTHKDEHAHTFVQSHCLADFEPEHVGQWHPQCHSHPLLAPPCLN